METDTLNLEMTVYPGSILSCDTEFEDEYSFNSGGNSYPGSMEEDTVAAIYVSEFMRSVNLVGLPLTNETARHIENFRSYNQVLMDFLRNDALRLEKKGNVCTTLFLDEAGKKLTAYCSLKCSTIKVKGASIPSLCPCVEVAVLCVDDRYRYQGIGSAILRRILLEVEKIRKKVGVELVTLFAVPAAVDFYKSNNFKELKDGIKILQSPSHVKCIPMYLRLPPKDI